MSGTHEHNPGRVTAGARQSAAERPLWHPSKAAIDKSAMSRFIAQAASRHGIEQNYDALYRWSIDQRAAFWSDVWEFTGIQSGRRWHTVLENGDAMPGARWFGGSRLNFAENLLRYRDRQPAIIFRGENGATAELTYRQLYLEVVRLSECLKFLGVKAGDRVAGYLSNCPEAVTAMLATASIGAIWSCCSPDFGVKGVLERFTRIKPRVLFAIDGYHYNGRRFDTLESVAEIADNLDSIAHLIIVPFANSSPDIPSKPASIPASLSRKSMRFDEFTTTRTEMEFAQLPFDHPLYILYSSGTTGAPKCIVHGAGGTLIQHLKEHQLHVDITRRDRLFYFTTCGWMMWNWLVSGLASGCTLILYDGSPVFPRRRSLWQLAEELGISVFGTSARYIAALAKARIHPAGDYPLAALRAILSTGSPLAAESFDYVYRHIKSDLMLASISGGTDIVSCFVIGNPVRPVYRGEIQGRGLGMAVDTYINDGKANGKPVRGQPGELVCTRPFPSMPLGFWNEPGQHRYHDAYFSRFDNVWAQGDYAEITRHDGVIIHGRSDAVLNPGGVRIGTAEIYRQVEKVDEVLESLCIAQTWEDDVRIVLFVMLREGAPLTDELKAAICDTIQTNTTRRHVPKKIIAVADIPRTLSGKIVELAVRNVVHGEPVRNTEALVNPEALEHFRNLPELREE